MPILILVYIQYLLKVNSSFEKGLNAQNLHRLPPPDKKISPKKNFRFPRHPLMLFGKYWIRICNMLLII